jgi:hypothetical protein
MAMHGLRSALLAGEGKAAAAQPSTEEECRRKGARDPSRAPTPERVRDDRRVAAQRKSQRHRQIVERATIYYGGKRALVRVVNVSARGLTIESPIVPAAGETMRIALEAGSVDGVVRWVRRGRIGLDVAGGTGVETDRA